MPNYNRMNHVDSGEKLANLSTTHPGYSKQVAGCAISPLSINPYTPKLSSTHRPLVARVQFSSKAGSTYRPASPVYQCQSPVWTPKSPEPVKLGPVIVPAQSKPELLHPRPVRIPQRFTPYAKYSHNKNKGLTSLGIVRACKVIGKERITIKSLMNPTNVESESLTVPRYEEMREQVFELETKSQYSEEHVNVLEQVNLEISHHLNKSNEKNSELMRENKVLEAMIRFNRQSRNHYIDQL